MTVPRPTFQLPLAPREGLPRSLQFGARTLVMGIVNATPDSFSDGDPQRTAASAIAHALRLIDEGADILDVGGESTRPSADAVNDDEQRRRVLPVIEAVAALRPAVPISIDTRSAAVARDGVRAGAAIVNDVSGLAFDPEMRRTVARLGVPAVVMHMRGTPTDMTSRATYDDLIADVHRELSTLLDLARNAGVSHLIADPGIGFAKTPEQSMALLAATDRFLDLNVPLLIGASRKRFLELVIDSSGQLDARSTEPVATRRRDASIAAAALAGHLGAHVVRVHDVRATVEAVRVADQLRVHRERIAGLDCAAG